MQKRRLAILAPILITSTMLLAVGLSVAGSRTVRGDERPAVTQVPADPPDEPEATSTGGDPPAPEASTYPPIGAKKPASAPARPGRDVAPLPPAETTPGPIPGPSRDMRPVRVGRAAEPPPIAEPVEQPAPATPVRVPVRVGRMEIPVPVPAHVGRVEAPMPVPVRVPVRVGRMETPVPVPTPAPTRVGRVDPPAPPVKRVDPPQPTPAPAPAPAPVRRVEVTDISYTEETVEAAQVDELYRIAIKQFEKLAPQLEKCDLDRLPIYVNVECTTKEHYWHTFTENYMWIDRDGTIGQWSSDCVGEYLRGASMPVGKTHPGQWTVKYKILRSFRPNPDGGTLCPYKGLVE
jgi:hypothetical protein